jgi:hypothetical protein
MVLLQGGRGANVSELNILLGVFAKRAFGMTLRRMAEQLARQRDERTGSSAASKLAFSE